MDKPWKVVCAFLGVFIAGAVFGGFFSLGIGRKIWEMEAPPPAKLAVPQPQALAQPTPPQPPKGQPTPPLSVPQTVLAAQLQLMRQVANQANLTPAQKALVLPIVQRTLEDFWHQQQNFSREYGYLVQRMRREIAKELTPEQQTRVDNLWSKKLETFRKRQVEAQAQARDQAQTQSKPAEGTPAPEAKDQPAPAAKPPGGG
jgi:hypothetical protein